MHWRPTVIYHYKSNAREVTCLTNSVIWLCFFFSSLLLCFFSFFFFFVVAFRTVCVVCWYCIYWLYMYMYIYDWSAQSALLWSFVRLWVCSNSKNFAFPYHFSHICCVCVCVRVIYKALFIIYLAVSCYTYEAMRVERASADFFSLYIRSLSDRYDHVKQANTETL